MADILRRTPLYQEHLDLKARIVPFAGWEMPIQYKGIVAEHQAVRERAGIFDVCHMGELLVQGPEALRLVNELVTNDLSKIEDGQAMYTCCCNEQGTILDDLIIYKRAPDDILIVCNASNREKISGHVKAFVGAQARFEDISDKTALLALQGPQAFAVLDALGTEPQSLASELKPFRFRTARVGGVECTVARTGYTGEDGVELFCANDEARRLFAGLMKAGTPLGLEPVGLGARDTLRLEARLSLYGNDIDDTTNPLEAGLGWVVKLDKASFVGKAALLAVQAAGLRRKLVGFQMTGKGIARHGYPLLDPSGKSVGICTSGGPSPTLGISIGLGYLPANLAEIGTRFLVDCRGKSIEAVVVKTPFYKRPRVS